MVRTAEDYLYAILGWAFAFFFNTWVRTEVSLLVQNTYTSRMNVNPLSVYIHVPCFLLSVRLLWR